MTHPAALDPDLLRTFTYIAEDGSFTRAAQRVGRTQSAVSMQIQRLERMLGERLLSRGKGGAVQLTPHGEFLLRRARDLLALNDEIWTSFRVPTVHGTIRLGTPDDYALRYLPGILKRFAESHPSVQVDVPVPAVVRPGGEAAGGRAGPDAVLGRLPAAGLRGGAAVAGAADLDHLQPPLAAPAGPAAGGIGPGPVQLGGGGDPRAGRGGAALPRGLPVGDAAWHARAGGGGAGGHGVHDLVAAGGLAGRCGKRKGCRRCRTSAS